MAGAEESGYGVLIAGAAVKGATTALVKDYVERVVNPYIRGLSSPKIEKLIRQNIARYIKNVEARTRCVSSIALPSGVFPLDEVYEPLTLKSDAIEDKFVVNSYPVELFRAHRCAAVTDDAGMGKSTLAKYIVRRGIETDRHIPLFIELRRLREGKGILDSLCLELAGDVATSAAGVELTGLFAGGNFLFVLDGFDEAEDDLRSDIAAEINSLAARFQFCYFLVTSRRDYGAGIFPGFSQFEIAPLTELQAFSLLHRYDQGRGVAKALIGKIKEAQVSEFLGNPLMVTLLYRAFDHRKTIPPKRSIFFRQVYEALFQDHDLSKEAYERGKGCGLDIDDFHRFLRSLGFVTLKAGRDSFSSEEFCVHLAAAVERSGLSVEWQKLKVDLLRAVPVFRKDGLEFRWAHKSFLEYFAAQYILFDLGGKRELAVERLFQQENALRYKEVLRFIAEADVHLVRERCIVPMLEPFFDRHADEYECASALLYESSRINYVGNGASDGRSRRSRLNALLHERVTEGPRGFSHIAVTMAEGCAVFSFLQTFGVKLALLAELDKELVGSRLLPLDFAVLANMASALGDKEVALNATLDEQKEHLPSIDQVVPMMRIAQLPAVDHQTFQAIKSAVRTRRDALATALLDEF